MVKLEQESEEEEEEEEIEKAMERPGTPLCGTK